MYHDDDDGGGGINNNDGPYNCWLTHRIIPVMFDHIINDMGHHSSYIPMLTGAILAVAAVDDDGGIR